jgi:hypothetical protein
VKIKVKFSESFGYLKDALPRCCLFILQQSNEGVPASVMNNQRYRIDFRNFYGTVYSLHIKYLLLLARLFVSFIMARTKQ